MSSRNVRDISSEKSPLPHDGIRSLLQYRRHIKVQFLLTRSRPVAIRNGNGIRDSMEVLAMQPKCAVRLRSRAL